MPIRADLALVAAGDDLLARWRDMGPALWLASAAMLGVWVLGLLLVAALRDPRKVQPVPALLEPQGHEPPAVVNLLATDWDLGHEAVPGTLVDLAARRYLDIDMVGDDTFVTVRQGPARGGDLTTCERMVLDHVRDLAGHTGAGRVPAQALTTGPEQSAKRWWKHFRGAVVDDARRRGLSQPRWSTGLKAAFVAAAVPIALTIALAGSTAWTGTEGEEAPPGSPVVGIWAILILSSVVFTRSGERDTPQGRECAARWLGLREQLAEDPLFGEQPPAAVAIWDRLLAHGTALGVAHGVVQALPLGAESERQAWSPVGGRWRVVRIRYPDWLPPGYGYHPLAAMFYGLLTLVVGVPATVFLLRGAADFSDPAGVDWLGNDFDPRLGRPLSLAAMVAAGLVGLVLVWGAWLVLAGFADLVSGRTTVEGRVLRVRERYKEDRLKTRHLAVDDGSGDKVRAWRFHSRTVGGRDDTVRGRVTHILRHVADLEVVRAAGLSAAEAVASAVAPAWGALPGDAPPPPLPADATVSAAAGFGVVRDPRGAPYPAALPGASATYRSGPAQLLVAWVPARMIAVYRHTPAVLHRDLPGLGDEAYRARWGGGVVARRGAHVVMVTPHLPGMDDAARDEIAARVAAAALAGAGPHLPGEAPQLPGSPGQVHQHVVDAGPG